MPSESTKSRSWVDRALSPFSEVKNGEGATALVLLATVFLLLVCYYILKTVREPLVAASAAQDLQLVQNTGLPEWLKEVLIKQKGPQLKAVAAAFQAILLLGFVPAYSWLAARVSRIRLIVGVSLFFIFCIELFFALRIAEVPMLGFVFYIWVGIFSIAMIAQFWSFANDLYSSDQGSRLFPIIGVGATAGSPVGAKVASLLYDYLAPEMDGDVAPTLDSFQRWVVESELDPSFILLQVPVILLVAFTALMVFVASRTDGSDDTTQAPKDVHNEPTEPKAGGFALILQSPYLRLIAIVILLLNVVNTMGELLLTDLVVQGAEAAKAAGEISATGPWIGKWYGEFFFYVNIIALVLQAFVVSRISKYLGLKGILFVLPIVALGTYGLFAAGLALAALRWAKSAENATDYSIMNTGKAMVWLPTNRTAKYQAKQAVDTFIVRVGDVIAAVLFLIGTSAMGWDLPTLAGINMAFVAAWLVATFFLAKRNQAITAKPSIDPVATGIHS